MKRILILAAVSATAALSACSTANQKLWLDDIQTCQRDYQGTVAAGVVGGGNFTGSVKVHCEPTGAKAAATVAPTTPAPST